MAVMFGHCSKCLERAGGNELTTQPHAHCLTVSQACEMSRSIIKWRRPLEGALLVTPIRPSACLSHAHTVHTTFVLVEMLPTSAVP